MYLSILFIIIFSSKINSLLSKNQYTDSDLIFSTDAKSALLFKKMVNIFIFFFAGIRANT